MVEFVDELADSLIHCIDHGSVDGSVLRGDTGDLAHFVFGVFGNRFFRRFKVEMGGVKGHEEEEGFLFVFSRNRMPAFVSSWVR